MLLFPRGKWTGRRGAWQRGVYVFVCVRACVCGDGGGSGGGGGWGGVLGWGGKAAGARKWEGVEEEGGGGGARWVSGWGPGATRMRRGVEGEGCVRVGGGVRGGGEGEGGGKGRGGGGGVVSWEAVRRGFFVKAQSNVLRSELAPCLPV